MESKAPDTLERIQQAALDEFSEKGFLGASLRQIVKQAGVTTGALYGWSNYGGLLRLFFQQRGSVCFHCRTACRYFDE